MMKGMRMILKSKKVTARGIKEGYKSGLEESISLQLTAHRPHVTWGYEKEKIKFVQPAKERSYTPDFILESHYPHKKIIIETKGRFVTADRQKHLMVQKQHPHLDIRFVFSNPNAKISKGSKTTYAMWCDKNNFKYAKKTIPTSWLKEIENGNNKSC